MRNQLLEKQLPQAAVAAPDRLLTPPTAVLGEPCRPWHCDQRVASDRNNSGVPHGRRTPAPATQLNE
jgi:hypothetical protein